MKAILLALIVLVVLSITPATSEWNQEARDYIVEIHNDKRRGENGCFMYKMEY
ncbi:protein jagged-1 isoform X1, partial [Biomphalaria glabrata]